MWLQTQYEVEQDIGCGLYSKCRAPIVMVTQDEDIVHPLWKHLGKVQVTVKPIFTQEANIEAERILNSKSNILNIYGGNVRNSTNEAVQTIYQLTRRDTQIREYGLRRILLFLKIKKNFKYIL